MAALKWTESYGCYRASLGPGLHLTVNWSTDRKDGEAGTPYIGYVFGGKLNRKFAGLEEAQSATIGVARKHLNAALEKLEP